MDAERQESGLISIKIRESCKFLQLSFRFAMIMSKLYAIC